MTSLSLPTSQKQYLRRADSTSPWSWAIMSCPSDKLYCCVNWNMNQRFLILIKPRPIPWLVIENTSVEVWIPRIIHKIGVSHLHTIGRACEFSSTGFVHPGFINYELHVKTLKIIIKKTPTPWLSLITHVDEITSL